MWIKTSKISLSARQQKIFAAISYNLVNLFPSLLYCILCSEIWDHPKYLLACYSFLDVTILYPLVHGSVLKSLFRQNSHSVGVCMSKEISTEPSTQWKLLSNVSVETLICCFFLIWRFFFFLAIILLVALLYFLQPPKMETCACVCTHS